MFKISNVKRKMSFSFVYMYTLLFFNCIIVYMCTHTYNGEFKSCHSEIEKGSLINEHINLQNINGKLKL